MRLARFRLLPRRRRHRRPLRDTSTFIVALTFAVASMQAAWFYHAFDRFGWPLLEAMNAMPLAAWLRPRSLLAVALLVTVALSSLCWGVFAATMLDELRRRMGAGEERYSRSSRTS